jgi:hypothetical protein
LTTDSARHAILVTATPHSGIEENFRSLPVLLDPEFNIGALRGPARQSLLRHIVQRRRADIEKWMDSETPFPERQPAEERPYSLSTEYRDLYNSVITFLRGTFAEPSSSRAGQQRIRHWAAIAALRSILSSPESALATLTRNRKNPQSGTRPRTRANQTKSIVPRYWTSCSQRTCLISLQAHCSTMRG